MSDLSVFSFGGGVQSTAALVLAAQGRLARTFLFANVGDDSENPATIEYVNRYSKPYAAAQGLEFVELHPRRSLLAKLSDPNSRSVGIPVRMKGGAPGRRQCTMDFKIRLIARWLKAHGASAEAPAQVGIGFTIDEWHRARSTDDTGFAWTRSAYPLIDLRLNRNDCEVLIRGAGLPPAPKSSCWFCPMHTVAAWKEQRRKEPELFQRSADLEANLNERRRKLGKDEVFFSSRLKPLPMAIQEDGQQDFLDDSCDSGYCFV